MEYTSDEVAWRGVCLMAEVYDVMSSEEASSIVRSLANENGVGFAYFVLNVLGIYAVDGLVRYVELGR